MHSYSRSLCFQESKQLLLEIRHYVHGEASLKVIPEWAEVCAGGAFSASKEKVKNRCQRTVKKELRYRVSVAWCTNVCWVIALEKCC